MMLSDSLLLPAQPKLLEQSRSCRLTFKVLLLTPVRCHRQSGLGSADARFPLKFSPSRAYLRSPWRALRPLSARGLRSQNLTV